MGLLKGYEDLEFVEITLSEFDRVAQWIMCRGCGKGFEPNSTVRRIVLGDNAEYFCQDCWEEFDVSLDPYHHGGLDA